MRDPTKTSTKEFCDTIAASIARYEMYRYWASKDLGALFGGLPMFEKYHDAPPICIAMLVQKHALFKCWLEANYRSIQHDYRRTLRRFHRKGAFFHGKGPSHAPQIPHRHPLPLLGDPVLGFSVNSPPLLPGGGGVRVEFGEHARPVYRAKKKAPFR